MRRNQLNGSGGTAPLTYALQTGGNAATAGTYRHDPGQANGSYVYTLTQPFDTSPDADNGANTEVAESFTYVVTDANGNTATGTITVNIVDDVPTAVADIDSVERRRHCHRQRADRGDRPTCSGRTAATVPGGGVVGVRAAGGDLTTDVTTGVGSPIAGTCTAR